MRDFTLYTFHYLLTALKAKNYRFQTFADFLKNPVAKSVILRHDVDARKMNSLVTARIEKELGITGTYYFRMVPESFDKDVIKEIAGLGHEIGYHYEDLSLMAKRRKAEGGRRKVKNSIIEEELVKTAIESFTVNLEKLRRIVPVVTACMHGSPLSKWDNRLLWKYYNYRDFGIIGEPYFDIDFNEILYLTDTGRRWDGDAVNIRDKVAGKEGTQNPEPRTLNSKSLTLNTELNLHSTIDIITAIKENKLPDKIMITIHPQRWDSRPLPWITELALQNLKNIVKRVLAQSRQTKLF